ncbi:MAG: flavin reductase family protein [Gemmatimonadota bacterium]|jgi:flavin reductase (DIM6/NTAB) family NADH-FMN oxidoreductase RutF
MTRHPIDPDVGPGRTGPVDTPGVDPDDFRDALARWAATVTIVAVRDGSDVHGVTVTSFIPVSAEPPRVLVSLGPNARVVPFLDEGTSFAVSLLDAGQRRVASDFADSYQVGASPFVAAGPPVVEGAVVALVCGVERLIEVQGGVRLVLAQVHAVRETGGDEPLVYHRRGYRRLEAE